MNTIKIKLKSGACVLKKATEGSAAYDIKVCKETFLKYGRQILPTGLSLEMPPHIAVDCRARSGYSAKGLLVTNNKGCNERINADVQLGLIDSDYRGEIGIILNVKDWRLHPLVRFFTRKKYSVYAGQAVAQLKFVEVPDTAIVYTEELNETKRGNDGFGKANGE